MIVPLAKQKFENMGRLLEVGRLLSSTLELPELLHAIMPLAARVVDADRASLFLVDPDTEELYFDVALGLDPEVAKIRLKMGQGIAGTVAKSKKPVVINDHFVDGKTGMAGQAAFITVDFRHT